MGLARTIVLDVGNETVTFTTEGRAVSFRPFVYIRDGVIVGIGDSPEGNDANVTRVDLRPVAPESIELVAKFIAHGIRAVVGRSLMIKPHVRIHLAYSADSGYWADAARQAMAASVTIA